MNGFQGQVSLVRKLNLTEQKVRHAELFEEAMLVH